MRRKITPSAKSISEALFTSDLVMKDAIISHINAEYHHENYMLSGNSFIQRPMHTGSTFTITIESRDVDGEAREALHEAVSGRYNIIFRKVD